MKIIEIAHIIDDAEQEKELNELVKRCEKLNGWTEKDLLQFTVQTMPMYRVWLMYLDDIVHDLEQEKINKSFWNYFKNGKRNKENPHHTSYSDSNFCRRNKHFLSAQMWLSVVSDPMVFWSGSA